MVLVALSRLVEDIVVAYLDDVVLDSVDSIECHGLVISQEDAFRHLSKVFAK